MAGKNEPRRSSRASASARKRKFIKRLKITLVASVIVICPVVAFGIFKSNQYLEEARAIVPKIEDKIDELSKKPTIFVSSDGVELFRRTAENRVLIHLKDLKPMVWHAFLAAEDKRFMEHGGFDTMGLARAAVNVITHKKGGGSTITMQLAKLLYNGSDQSLDRKLRDIALAKAIEETKSKADILELYLNYVFFGQRSNGLCVAAKTYFGKEPNKLTPREAAMLARCVRRPSERNPAIDYDQSIKESDAVLKTMLEEKWITQEEFDRAWTDRPDLADDEAKSGQNTILGAPYAVDHAKSELQKLYGNIPWESGGYTIELTIDSKLQSVAEQSVKEVVNDYRRQRINSGAFVVANRYGRILAEVGGMDYAKSQFNLATQGQFQPGSSFKAIVYTTAFREGIVHEGDTLPNRELTLEDPSKPDGWHPKNSNRNENAYTVSIETAFAQSWNRPAIWTLLALGAGSFESAESSVYDKLLQRQIVKTGVGKVVTTAKDIFGIDVPPGQRGAAIALGANSVTPLQMLSAYSTFMLKGSRVEPRIVAKVISPDGEVVGQLSQTENLHRGVLEPVIVDQMDHLMEGVVNRPGGTGREARIVPNARGKTGTTNDNKDAWFCGYTDGLVGVGWVGNLNLSAGKAGQSTMSRSVYGGTVTAKIWAKVMVYAHDKFASVISEPDPASQPEPERPKKQDEQPKPVDDEGNPIEPGTVKVAPPEENPPSTKGPPDDAGAAPQTAPADPPKGPPTRTPDPDTKPKSTEPEDVEVEICADTGLVANRYCPETVTRRFRKGREPKRTCTTHHGQ